MPSKVLTINIRKYLVKQPRGKRIRKGSRYLRERIAHYTKTDIDKVKISRELNNLMVKYYSIKMKPVKVNVNIDAGIATASPFGTVKSKTTETKAPSAEKGKEKGMTQQNPQQKPAKNG